MAPAKRIPPLVLHDGRQPVDPNIVIVVLDDGGAEWFDWSGLLEPAAGFVKHPRLSELRARGVTFTRAYACPICAPSRARLWSGSYGFDLGLAGNPATFDDYAFCGGGASIANWQNPPPITARLLPRLLRIGRDGSDELPPAEQSYASASFGKSHLHSDEGRETWPIDHGLLRYVGCQPNAGKLPQAQTQKGHFQFAEVTHSAGGAPSVKVWGAPGVWPNGGPYVAYDTSVAPDAGWDAYTVYRNAVQWMNTRTKPFLALVNFNPPHAPFEVPPFDAPDDVGHGASGGRFAVISRETRARMLELDGGGKGPGWVPPFPVPDVYVDERRAIYRANLEAIDTLIGTMWDRLDPVLRARTVFLVIGDNGTVSNVVDAPYDAGRAKRTPYEMGARVPCVAWGPPDIVGAPGRTSDHLVHIVDLLPTVLEITRCDPELWNPEGSRVIRGRSIAGILRDAATRPGRDHVYNELFLPLNGTRDGPVPIDPSRWIRTYTDGKHKIIERPTSTEMYRIDASVRPSSGLPGYLERPEDDLFPLVGTPGNEDLTQRFLALQAELHALVES